MQYILQGWNTDTKQWETLPYQTEDFRTLYIWPLEHMAIEAMKTYAQLWPGEYRVIPTKDQ